MAGRSVDLQRRRLLKTAMAAAGAPVLSGLVVGFQLGSGAPRARAQERERDVDDIEINAWLRIGPDGRVTVLVAQSELGQGVTTALPMAVAEELEVDWRRIRFEMAPAAPVYANPRIGMQGTWSSSSLRSGGFDRLREAGAKAREMLRQAAASRWNVPLEDCRAADGRIAHAPSGRSLGYGALAHEASKLEPPAEVRLKSPDDWSLVGTSPKRLDSPAKLDGTAVFGIDVSVPGMLTGAVAHCPSFGGRLIGGDTEAASAMPGVRAVVPLKDSVVIVAEKYWQAQAGLAAYAPEWDPGPNADLDDETLAARYIAALSEPGDIADDTGDTEDALAGAAVTLEAAYDVPFLAHLTMEPMNATARVTVDAVDIWAPTQNQSQSRAAVARALGVDPGIVRIHTTLIGCGFGRRIDVEFIVEAALVARAAAAPVKVIWSREEDLRHDVYRPAARVAFRAGLDRSGRLDALDSRLVSPSVAARYRPSVPRPDRHSVEGIADTPYEIASRRCSCFGIETPIPVGFWRSVGNSHNTFFLECFLDELAQASGQDPLAFRLRALQRRPRHRAVLETAAERSAWGEALPPGRARGIALAELRESIVAQVVELSLEPDKRIALHRVVCVIDCGLAIHPDSVVAQMEGGIAYGLCAAMNGKVTIRNGAVVEGNFNTHPTLTLDQMPPVEVEVIESGAPLGGVGEAATPAVAPALCNAIFAAGGERIRSLPLSRHGFRL